MSPPLHVILYRSIASQAFSPRQLKQLVLQSQARNAEREVTGVLLYGTMSALPHVPGTFVQWIEGPEAEVRALYKAIAADRRHHEIEVYSDAPLASLGRSDRLFGQWAMASASMADLPASLDGFLSAYRELNLSGRPA